jgi:hypothetical protein
MPAELSGEAVDIRAGVVAKVMSDVAGTFYVRIRERQQDISARPFPEKRMRAQYTPDLDARIMAEQFNGRFVKVVHASDRAADLPRGVPCKMAKQVPVVLGIIEMADEADDGFVPDLFIENPSDICFNQ